MKIALLIFDCLSVLDGIGPYSVLARLTGAKLGFVAVVLGFKRTDNGRLGLEAEKAIEDVPEPDILLVPGGKGNRALMSDERVLDWLRCAHERSTWTTSVCTGSLVLGAAGILEGKRATSHWAYRDALRQFGAEPVAERVVEDGKVVTAAGVAAGIDMALHLSTLVAGPEVAQAIQLGIEYDPAPPHDTGSPEKAPPELVELIRSLERPAAEHS